MFSQTIERIKHDICGILPQDIMELQGKELESLYPVGASDMYDLLRKMPSQRQILVAPSTMMPSLLLTDKLSGLCCLHQNHLQQFQSSLNLNWSYP